MIRVLITTFNRQICDRQNIDSARFMYIDNLILVWYITEYAEKSYSFQITRYYRSHCWNSKPKAHEWSIDHVIIVVIVIKLSRAIKQT